MFDLRYHVASLAAVFVALIVGILVGVGLAGSGVTNEADLSAARFKRDQFQKERDAARGQVKDLQKAEKAFETAYPVVVRNLLAGKRIAVLFVGHTDGGINQTIEQTLLDAGAEPVVRVIALSLPVSAEDLDSLLFEKGPQFVKYVGNDNLESLGKALGSEFANGGQTPLWKALGKELIGERSGNLRQRIDGLVVARTVKPQAGDTARFLQGVYAGAAAADMPVVGVENSNMTPSAVGVFRDRGLSTVDDIDLTTGRVALAMLLAGANPGKYGTRDFPDDTQNNADAILPTFPGG